MRPENLDADSIPSPPASDISPRPVIDYSEQWTDEDLRDFVRASIERADDGTVSAPIER